MLYPRPVEDEFRFLIHGAADSIDGTAARRRIASGGIVPEPKGSVHRSVEGRTPKNDLSGTKRSRHSSRRMPHLQVGTSIVAQVPSSGSVEFDSSRGSLPQLQHESVSNLLVFDASCERKEVPVLRFADPFRKGFLESLNLRLNVPRSCQLGFKFLIGTHCFSLVKCGTEIYFPQPYLFPIMRSEARAG